MWLGGVRACEVMRARRGWRWCPCLGGVGGGRYRIGDELLRVGRGRRFCFGLPVDDVHCGRFGVGVGESWAITGAHV